MYKSKDENILLYIDMSYELLQFNHVLCDVKEHINAI